ncbi:hypothetical protein GYMLUDRAFT_516507 [Collybiopsis luxurians FD-317 M1]|nr:hypothetical protein GYMLUDRAFT_516507 [Collybiopsis luxurians FD-317 M1]
MASEKNRRSWKRLSISSLASLGTVTQLSESNDSSPSPPPSSSSSKRHSLTLILPKNSSLHSNSDSTYGHALERTISSQHSIKEGSRSGSFGKSLTSMMGGFPGLSNLSLSRTSTKDSMSNNEDVRGRSLSKGKHHRSSSHAPPAAEAPSRSQSRARSQSPFSFRRFRSQRDPSPVPPLPLSSNTSEMIQILVTRQRPSMGRPTASLQRTRRTVQTKLTYSTI